jgi:hypothetical protein
MVAAHWATWLQRERGLRTGFVAGAWYGPTAPDLKPDAAWTWLRRTSSAWRVSWVRKV